MKNHVDPIEAMRTLAALGSAVLDLVKASGLAKSKRRAARKAKRRARAAVVATATPKAPRKAKRTSASRSAAAKASHAARKAAKAAMLEHGKAEYEATRPASPMTAVPDDVPATASA